MPGPISTLDQRPDEGATTTPDPSTVLEDVRGMLAEVMGEDFVTEIDIELDTSFNLDLEVESIEFVALAELLHERYGRTIDFAGWLAGMEVDEIIALTVGELVDFIVS